MSKSSILSLYFLQSRQKSVLGSLDHEDCSGRAAAQMLVGSGFIGPVSLLRSGSWEQVVLWEGGVHDGLTNAFSYSVDVLIFIGWETSAIDLPCR